MKKLILAEALYLLCAISTVTQANTTNHQPQEKLIYSTDFSHWTDLSFSNTETTVSQNTKYTHEQLNFYIMNTQVSSTNGNTAKFPLWTGGYLMANKSSTPYITTSTLKNISKVHFIHGATGSKRGWKLEAKGDGDADWMTVSDTYATTNTGTDVNVDINKNNCQLRFTNLNEHQNAYLFQLDIYGWANMSSSPILDSFVMNGTTYKASDIFSEDNQGKMVGTIERSKKSTPISESNPLTQLLTENGNIGTLTYQTKDDTTIVNIPVTLEDKTVHYALTIVPKPDFSLTYIGLDGQPLGTQTIEKDETIGHFAYDSSAIPQLQTGYAFRGWFAQSGGKRNRKFNTNDIINKNTSLYAVATPIEGTSPSARYEYDLTDNFFYAEDHEAFDLVGKGKFHDSTHGYLFKAGDKINLKVGGNAYILLSLCQYTKEGYIIMTNAKGEEVGNLIGKGTMDGATGVIRYQGQAGTLTLNFPMDTYLHKLTIVNNAHNDICKNNAGYYIVKVGDAENLLSVIDIANAQASNEKRTYIFIPNGEYNLGETVLTPISGNNISLIGQNAEKTIIKNAPKLADEGIAKTATLLITGQNTYLQDLTLQNAMPYQANVAAGRAVVIQDKGHRTICKNVRLLSYQDTYYSNSDGQFYFEDGEIHGVVDYVCGSGDVYYNNVKFVVENRGSNTANVIAAPNPGASVRFGYVMNNCSIINLNTGGYSLGRSWGGLSKLTWINTTMSTDANNDNNIKRFTIKGMNTAAYSFKEFNSHDSKGHVLTPINNIVTFTHNSGNYTYNTTLTANEVTAYTIDKVFPDWTPATLTIQAPAPHGVLKDNQLTWTSTSTNKEQPAYAIFKAGQLVDIISSTNHYIVDGQATDYQIRAANVMGGFGPSTPISTGVLTTTTTDKKENRNTHIFNGQGVAMPTQQKGLNIIVQTQDNGKNIYKKIIRP